MAKKTNRNDDDFLSFLKYHMDNTPGFVSLLKFVVFVMIALILIGVARSAVKQDLKIREEQEKNTTTPVMQRTAYKKLIDDIINKEAKIMITIGDNTYMIDNMINKDGEISGLFENENGTKKFRIKDNTIYEKKLGKDVENNELFAGLEKNFIIPTELIKILESNKTIKQVNNKNVTYTYNMIVNEVVYDTIVTIVDDEIVSISIKNDTTSYIFTYTKPKK